MLAPPAMLREYNPFAPKVAPRPDASGQAFNAYDTALKRQGDDYDEIMRGFRGAIADSGNLTNTARAQLDSLKYNAPAYQQTKDYTSAVGNLGELSRTGGYSPEDIAAIRERSISPIRSIYANAQRNIERQRALQGGYSPNFTAAASKMARGMAGQISDTTVKANADIAQNVAANRLAASTPYASITANEQNARNTFAQSNAENAARFGLDRYDRINQITSVPLQMKLSALQGMAGLYGTQPGLTTTTQRGALNTAELQNQIKQQNTGTAMNAAMNFWRG